MRYLLLIAVVVLLIGCVNANGEKGERAYTTTKTIELEVGGLVCSYCADTIKTYLMNTEGIAGVEVNLENRSVRVTYDPSIITEEEILNLKIFSGPFKARLAGEA
jgi:copper chaperone CopZ